MAKKSKEKTHEIFEVEKKGKKKIVDIGVNEKEERPGKKQIEDENKILKKVFMIVGILVLLVIVYYFVAVNLRNFEYRGVEFEVVKFCDAKPCLVLYQTSFPVIADGEPATYNIYLRNDPREVDKDVPFTGESFIMANLVLNSTGNLGCEGYGAVATANMKTFYELFGIKVFKNDSLSCSQKNEYTFVNLLESNETSVEQVGNSSCYNIKINNCEILEGTERFMIESFVQVNEMIKEN